MSRERLIPKRLAIAIAGCAFTLAAIGATVAAGTDEHPSNDPEEAKLPFNIPMPTLGGKQVWSDVALLGDWRIQENSLTGHCRVLDGGDVRRAWGNLEQCIAALRAARSEEKLAFSDRHIVLLLHGLGRNRSSLAGLAAEIENAGFQAETVAYASTRLELVAHADNLIELLASLTGIDTVSFITHSMGGMVVRQALTAANWPAHITVDGLVMLAPPSTGAELADRLERFASLRLIMGQAAQELTTVKAAAVPLPTVRHCIIAGGRSDDEGYNPWLDGDDDGIVRVAEARLPDSDDFLLVDSLHTFIMDKPATLAATIRFLRGGRCDGAGTNPAPAPDPQ